MSVSAETPDTNIDASADRFRETLGALSARYALPATALAAIERLLLALEREPDPPTTVRDRVEALDAHVADSLSGLEVVPLRAARRIADIGAGAGFPGLPLAVALPGARVELVESSARKCELIARLASAAGVTNAHAVRARAEEFGASQGSGVFEAVTARAVDALPVLVEYAAPLLAEGGHLVAWKGARESSEEAAGDEAARVVGLELAEVRPVVPFEAARDRHLHIYRKVDSTPDRFPRRPGMARKRPLGSDRPRR